jgi:predicted HicB family RNase H-like nuclease
MNPGLRITQLRIPAELYERIRERAYRKRESINKTMVELMEERMKEEEAA